MNSNIGVPFFQNWKSSEYGGHNRNFGVVCNDDGRVFIANFEGLIVYDGESWEMIHTPGVSRITSVFRSKDNTIWFGGNNVLGYISSGDSILANFVIDDKKATQNIGEVMSFFEKDSKLYFTTNNDAVYNIANKKVKKAGNILPPAKKDELSYKDYVINDKITIPDQDIVFYATASHGVIATNKKGQQLYNLTKDNGLCSNTITYLAYDGKGTIWGTTDNGLFSFNSTTIYTHFTENEGLDGQVMSILPNRGKLLVGTLQGVFMLENNNFKKLQGLDQACWQIIEDPNGNAMIASAEGVFVYKDKLYPYTHNHTFSVIYENNDTYLSAELDGIYRHHGTSSSELLDKIPNVVKLESDGKGGIWALSLYGKTYFKSADDQHFKQKDNKNLNLLFHYVDYKKHVWHPLNNGKGLVCNGIEKKLEKWLNPFNDYTIQTICVNDGIAWLGGSFGIVRFDVEQSKTAKDFLSKVYIRYFKLNDTYLNFTVATDQTVSIGKNLYSYRLNDNEEWSKWNTVQDIELNSLAYGHYQLTVRSKDAFGNISISESREFYVPRPIYLRWYAISIYVLLLLLAAYGIFLYRTRMLRKEQQRLENIVNERTQQVVAQKNEIEAQKDEIEAQKNDIEEKSHKLEDTLVELRNTQNQLLRQEREATVGKLTKGLIDRILNPMNYINNFSHLTLGLTKDIRENIEDEEEKMDPDNFEDCMDVIDMMKTNLEKIEQHGLSTTRILKAMEEMLRERSGKIETHDVAMICQQNIEMLNKYFANDIAALGIKVIWDKPELPIVSEVNPELLSRCFMSMLSNSIYAVKKKAEKGIKNGIYVPEIRVSIHPKDGEHAPSVYFYDNGIGIEESIIDKVFDPFFTTKPTAEAPGVGLYLSQQIIQDMGGTISVESVKDDHTTFTVSLL